MLKKKPKKDNSEKSDNKSGSKSGTKSGTNKSSQNKSAPKPGVKKSDSKSGKKGPRKSGSKSNSKADSLIGDDKRLKGPGELLTNKDTAQSIQKIIERLSYLYGQHKEIYDNSKKNYHEKLQSQNFSKLTDIVELIRLHQDLLYVCQSILSSSIFLQFTIETMNTLWMTNNNYKNEAKYILKINRNNNSKLSNLQNYLKSLKVKKDVLIDDIQYYRNSWIINALNEDERLTEAENEIWDILASAPSEKGVPVNLYDIDDALFEETVNVTENKVRSYLVEGRVDENIGSFILSIAKRCLYLDAPVVAGKIINLAMDILLRFCDKRSIKFSLLSMAEAFVAAHLKNYPQAVNLAKEAAVNIENLDDSFEDEKNFIKFHLGFILVKWKSPNDGLPLLEDTEVYFEMNIPDTEEMWRNNIIVLTRFYNEFRKTDAAFEYSEKLVKKYHEAAFGPISVKNKTISDIASDLMSQSLAASRLMEKVSNNIGCLPPYTMDILKEMVIVFATKYNFQAARLVENYIKQCIEYHKKIMATTDNFDESFFQLNIAPKPKPQKSMMPIQKIKNVLKK